MVGTVGSPEEYKCISGSKKPKTRVKNLLKLGVPEWVAYELGYSRKAYWRMSGVIQTAITNKRLAQTGYYDISQKYKSLHLCG